MCAPWCSTRIHWKPEPCRRLMVESSSNITVCTANFDPVVYLLRQDGRRIILLLFWMRD